MGPEQQKAASYYLYGEDGRLSFQEFPVQTTMSTQSADNTITDSAASATAMSTGQKVNNGVISRAIPGDSSDLQTIIEAYKAEGKAVGIVTTTFVTHATPAAFTAHADNRSDYEKIGEDLFTATKPDIIFGGGGSAYGINTSTAVEQGYSLAEDAAGLDSVTTLPAAGLFGDDHIPYEYDGLGSLPHLSEMALKAVELLSEDPDGFLLMIEGGRIDHACHSNDIVRAVYETVEFSKTVQAVVDEVSGRDDILLIVTADHETGGLSVTANNGTGQMPTVGWSTTGHTGIDVPVYAYGKNAEAVNNVSDNTDIWEIME